MISKTNLFCVLVLCNAVSAFNGQYGLNAFARPTLANLFNVSPRIRTLQNREQAPPTMAPTMAQDSGYGQQYAPQQQQYAPQQQQQQYAPQQQQYAPQQQQQQYSQPGQYMQSAPQSSGLVNNCAIGMVEPIHEGEVVTETYCRCPSGTYGFTCQENFNNPCAYNGGQYHPADPSVGPHYFIECNWNTPYLFKCPADLVWNQSLETCDWQHQAYDSYNSYGTSETYAAPAPTPAYTAQAYVAPTPAYTAPAYVAPTPAYTAPAYVAPTPAYTAPAYVAPTPAYVAPTPAYVAPTAATQTVPRFQKYTPKY